MKRRTGGARSRHTTRQGSALLRSAGHLASRSIGFGVRRPLRLLSAILVLGSSSAIVSNALTGQTGPHPAPLFDVNADQLEAAASRYTNVAQKENARPMPIPQRPPQRSATDPVQTASLESAPPTPVLVQTQTVERPLIVAIQRELATKGLYVGDIDGLMGPKTRAAIRDFEASLDLDPTGRPSENLLDALQGGTLETRSTRVPPVPPARVDDPLAGLIASSSTRPTSGLEPDPRVRIVQIALTRAGYGPLDADGLLGQRTQAAVRAFERANGLEETGRIDDRLKAQLLLVGVLQE